MTPCAVPRDPVRRAWRALRPDRAVKRGALGDGEARCGRARHNHERAPPMLMDDSLRLLGPAAVVPLNSFAEMPLGPARTILDVHVDEAPGRARDRVSTLVS